MEPYRLVNWGRRWYLMAYDVDRQDWRIFRVDRVKPRTPTGPRFAPRQPPEADAAAYVARRVSSVPWRYLTEVTVKASAETVAERVPRQAGAIEAVDENTCILKTGGNSVEDLPYTSG